MNKSNYYINMDKEYISPTFHRYNLCFEKGNGSKLYDVNGNEYIDLTSGIGVISLGHCDIEFKEAIKNQAENLFHVSNYFVNTNTPETAKKLCSLTGASNVFFTNSGAESNECAIKAARKYSYDKYGSGRHNIITFKDSFHGRTITTLSATGQDVFHKTYNPFTQGFIYSEVNNTEQTKKLIDDTVCAVMIEPILGEGGVIEVKKEFIENIAELCKEKDILLIFDEVQTGIGRTGYFLANEYFKVGFDIVSLAKGIGNGLPIGAVLFGEKTKNVFSYSDHGTTFGGNPFVCAGANVVLNRFEKTDLINEIREKSKAVFKFINQKKQEYDLKSIKNIRGRGLIIGIELCENLNVSTIIDKLIEKNILTLSAKGNVLRLLPPLTIEKNLLINTIDIIIKTIKEQEDKK